MKTVLALAIACLALVAPIGGAGVGVGSVLAMGPLPACRYDDVLTTPRAYSDWPITLVDPILRVPSTYVPPDLVSTKSAGLEGGGSIRKVAIKDLLAMADAARAAGGPIAVESAYRSYAQQKVTFDHWVDTLGYKQALTVSARPGHSEHQLGLAIDFKSEPGGAPWNGGDWALTPAGAWMKTHAWQFGWVLSYPKDAFATVCYAYEPWHYRYVGRSLAAKIHAAGLTIREALWASYTTAVVPPPSPSPGGSGSPSTAPSSVPSPSPTVVPSTEPSTGPTESPAPTVASSAPIATEAPAEPTGGLTLPADLAVIAVVAGLVVLLVAALGFSLRRARRP